MKRIEAIPEIKHKIGTDAPLSHTKDLDTPYMEAAHQAWLEDLDGESYPNPLPPDCKPEIW